MILESDAELGEALAKLEQKTGEIAVLKYRIEKKDEEIARLQTAALPQKLESGEERSGEQEQKPAPVKKARSRKEYSAEGEPGNLEERLSARIAELERKVESLSRLNALDDWRKKCGGITENPESLYEKHPDTIFISYPIPTPGEIYRAMTFQDVRRRLWLELQIEISPKSLVDYLIQIGFVDVTESGNVRPTRYAIDNMLLLAPIADEKDSEGAETYTPKFMERGFLRLVEIIRERGLDIY